MKEDGWMPMIDNYARRPKRPLDYELVELYRLGWEKPVIQDPHTIHPLMNAEGLYWRPFNEVKALR